jgi:hypothetical protein
MFKMGLHNQFGHLKHKLWPKEGLGIKLAIWLLTIKSQESPQFPYVQVTCDMSLESSWQGLQLFFRPHLNHKYARKVMGPKVARIPSVRISGLPLGSLGTKWHLGAGSWLGTRYTIRGKVVAFPKFGPWWILWVWICSWFVLALKVL